MDKSTAEAIYQQINSACDEVYKEMQKAYSDLEINLYADLSAIHLALNSAVEVMGEIVERCDEEAEECEDEF